MLLYSESFYTVNDKLGNNYNLNINLVIIKNLLYIFEFLHSSDRRQY